jgi:MFS family permease
MIPDRAGPADAAPSMHRLALLALAGTTIEWYDFFLYGLGASLVFPALFFPRSLSPLVALMASYSTFAVGFLARPVGALIFGHVGDRVGRKTALAVALGLMGVATTLIACLPSYATAGALAPVLLVLLRFAQGLAIGGQWGGAMLLVTENAPAHRRGYYGSFAQAGVPAGVVLSNVAFLVASALTPPAAFVVWGWRLPFALSILLIWLGLYLHFRVKDTAVFRELQQQRAAAAAPPARAPIFEALRQHPAQIAFAAGSFVATNLIFYIGIVFSVAYGTSVAGPHVSRTLVLTAVVIGSAVAAPSLMLFGALSDRLGRRKVFLAGCLLTGLAAFAFFPLFDTGALLWMSVAIALNGVLQSAMYAPMPALFSELFGTRVRYSGASLGYQIGGILGGALAPLIATGLLARFHSTTAISVYMALGCLVSFISVALLPETAGISLHAVPGRKSPTPG